MLFHAMLREKPLVKLNEIGSVDIVIGLPTHKLRPRLVQNVAETALKGLREHYPKHKAVLINADTGKDPRVRNAVESLNSDDLPVIAGRYDGKRGQGAAICAILDAALTLEAKAIVILEGHTRSITPSWVPGLAELVLADQADLVKPRYYWPLPEGAMSDLLFHPFTRALWGLNLRHPAAGDFAMSPQLALAALNKDVWYTEVNKSGIDIWLSTFALAEDWRVAQSALGEKDYPTRKPGKRATSVFVESVGTMLRQLQLRQDQWPDAPPVRSLPTLTAYGPARGDETVPHQNCDEYIQSLALGWISYRSLWQRTLRPEHLKEVERLASQPNHRFYFPSDLWARIVYDFAVAYNKGDADPDAVAASLYPLYLGRLASFWTEVVGLTVIGREGTVSAQAVEFEENLDYLNDRWATYKPR